jgi:hypothetical protein
MGCVWLEMYTVLLGDKLEYLEQHRVLASGSFDIYDLDAEHGYRNSTSYAHCLPSALSWINRLQGYCKIRGSLLLSDLASSMPFDFSSEEIVSGLNDVTQMLQEEPSKRPDAASLRQKIGDNPCCRQDFVSLEYAEGPPSEMGKDEGESTSAALPS